MKLVILGVNGQVGHELQRSLSSLGEIIALDRSQADLSQHEKLQECLISLKPDVIINAAAYTAVDKAEEDEQLAMLINGDAPGIIAQIAKELNALFIHFSTDYVFDGNSKKPYHEEEIANPINVYGKSKLKGEIEIKNAGGNYLIFRTAWVYSLHGHNFLKTILRLAAERNELNIVNDQIGAPTWAGTIANVTANCIPIALDRINNNQFTSGIFHLTANGEISWYEFATRIVELAEKDGRWGKLQLKEINPIPTIDYPTPAKRPMYSVLLNKKIESVFGQKMPDWDAALLECLSSKNC